MSNVYMSVDYKPGLVWLARKLTKLGWNLLSSGETAKLILRGGLPCRVMKPKIILPEAKGGRRYRGVEDGLLGAIMADNTSTAHLRRLEAIWSDEPVRIVVCNLRTGGDTGGLTLIIEAANNPDVLVLVDPSDYEAAINALTKGDQEALRLFRARMATKAKVYAADRMRDAAVESIESPSP